MTASPTAVAKTIVKSGLDTLAPQLMRRKALRDVRDKRWGCAQNPRACVLLTGDLGKLGRYIARATERDYGLIGFDRQYSPKEDLGNYDALTEKMRNCQYVVHGAAIPHPGQGDMADYVHVNVVGTLNVLRAAQETGVKRVIYLSSVAYYGCNIRGRLLPSYFPIDEQHPIAAVKGQGTGGLDEYNQSKVMAEQLLAYYGTNKAFEVIALRLGPANSKADSYDDGFDWRQCTDYRRGCFFANCHPAGAAQAVRRALDAEGEFWYEPFNIVDRYTHEAIDVEEFLRTEYPDVPLKTPVTPHMGLIDISKAMRALGYEPIEDLR